MQGLLDGFGVLTLVLLVVALAVLFAGIKTVPQGEQWTVERFGRYVQTLMPGLRFIIPFVDRVGKRLSVMEQVLDVPAQTVITRDNAAVVTDGVVFFRIDDAARAAYQVQQLQEAIVNLTTTNLRSVIGAMDLDETLSNRQHINETLMGVVDDATKPWGVKIIRIEIRDIRMSEELQNAMNLQMTAERRRRATVTEANGRREAAVLEAEGEKQAQILRAQGLREAAFLEAEARERAAEAEAKATTTVSIAIREGDVRAVQYFVAKEYVAALQALGASPNSKVIMLPVESTGITGAVAGVAELLQGARSG